MWSPQERDDLTKRLQGPPAIILGGHANALAVARSLGRRGVRVMALANPKWVIRRVIMLGGLEDVRATRRFFGDDRVQSAAQHRSVDARTRRYWRIVSGAE